MKTFGQYVRQRLREDGSPPLGLAPTDVGIKAKDDGPLDRDQEVQMGKLMQLVKTATQKHPEQALGLLEKLADHDGEIRSGLESLKGEMHRSGNHKFKDKGLGHLGSVGDYDHKDQVMPPYADQTSAGETDGGGG
jgi:hypothetical protein